MAGTTHRQFGTLRKQRSGSWQASYTGPDKQRHNAPHTFATKTAAAKWLDTQRALIESGQWSAVVQTFEAPAMFGPYADEWLAGRVLKPRTRIEYRRLLDGLILPRFGDQPIKAITPAAVRAWHTQLGENNTPTRRSHAYGLLRTILGTAVHDGIRPDNPCHIRGAGNVKRASRTEPATLTELQIIAEAMPERYRAMVHVTAWCALRFGEAAELRRKDIDISAGVIRIRRGVVRMPKGTKLVDTPKSDAGIRDIAIPPHVVPILAAHLLKHAEPGPEGLVFPSILGGRNLGNTSLYTMFHPAREAAGRPDLRWHDLRHVGLTMAAQAGASIAELMARGGHSTPGAAMRYQHAAAGRDQAIAQALSKLASLST